MAGIKISQLPKWSVTDLEHIDASDILIPVSVNGVTGCLKANTLVNLLKNTPSDIDAIQNNNIANLNERLLYLSTVLDNFMDEMNRKYEALVEVINNMSGGGSEEPEPEEPEPEEPEPGNEGD